LTSNAELHARRQQAVPRGVTNSLAVYPSVPPTPRSDVEGRRYIDSPAASRYSTPATLHPKVQQAGRAAGWKNSYMPAFR